MPLVQTVTCAFQVCVASLPLLGVVAAIRLCADLIPAARVGNPLWLCWGNLWFRNYSIRQVF